jgi:hypothetical protein
MCGPHSARPQSSCRPGQSNGKGDEFVTVEVATAAAGAQSCMNALHEHQTKSYLSLAVGGHECVFVPAGEGQYPHPPPGHVGVALQYPGKGHEGGVRRAHRTVHKPLVHLCANSSTGSSGGSSRGAAGEGKGQREGGCAVWHVRVVHAGKPQRQVGTALQVHALTKRPRVSQYARLSRHSGCLEMIDLAVAWTWIDSLWS